MRLTGTILLVELFWVVVNLIGLVFDRWEQRDAEKDARTLASSGLNGPRTKAARANVRAAYTGMTMHIVYLIAGAFAMAVPSPVPVPISTYILAFTLTVGAIIPVVFAAMNRFDRKEMVAEANRLLDAQDPVLMSLVEAYRKKANADLVSELYSGDSGRKTTPLDPPPDTPQTSQEPPGTTGPVDPLPEDGSIDYVAYRGGQWYGEKGPIRRIYGGADLSESAGGP